MTLVVGASPYAITAVYGGDTTHNGSTSNVVKQTITPASLKITANNQTKTYGTLETFSATAFTETGLVTANGDTITGVTESSTAGPAAAAVGTYPITASNAVGSGLGNYTITYANGTLTVAALNWSTFGTIYVLDPKAAGRLTLSGSASINVTGNVIVDSSSSTPSLSAGLLGEGRRHPGCRGNQEERQPDIQSPTGDRNPGDP